MDLGKFSNKSDNFSKKLLSSLKKIEKELDKQNENFDLDGFFLLLGRILEKSEVSVLVSIFSDKKRFILVRYINDASDNKNLRESSDFFFLKTKISVDKDNNFSKYFLENKFRFILNRQKDIYKTFKDKEGFIKNTNWNSIVCPILIRGESIGFFEFLSPKIKKEHLKIFESFIETLIKNISSLIIFNELRETEEKYKDIFENSDEGFYILNGKKKKFNEVNKALSKISGYTKEELLQMNYIILFDYSERNKVSSYVKNRLIYGESKNSPKSYETKILCKNGELKDVKLVVSRYLNKEEWFVILNDITIKKSAERRLRDLNENQIILNKILNISLEDLSFDKKLDKLLLSVIETSWFRQNARADLQIILEEEKNSSKYFSSNKSIKRSKNILGFNKREDKRLKNIVSKKNIEFYEGKIKKEYVAGSKFTVNNSYIPLIHKGVVLGVLNLVFNSRINFATPEVEFIKAIASVFAATIDREKNKKKLEESEQKYRELVDNAVDMFVVLDLRKNIIFTNKAFDNGFSDEKFKVNPNFSTLVHKNYLERFNKEYLSFLKHKKEWKIEFKTTEKSTNIYVSAIFTVIVKNEEKIATQAIIRDITSARIAEQKMYEAKKHYLNVIDTIRDDIFTVDEKCVVTSCNRGFADKVKMPIEEIKNKKCSEILSKYDNDLFQEENGELDNVIFLIKSTFKKKEFFTFEKKTNNKKERYYKITISATKNKKGKAYQVVVTISDITENRKTKEELRRLDEFKNRVLNNVPVSIIMLNKKGEVVSLNQQAESLVGKKLIGEKLTSTNEIKENKILTELYKKLIKKGESFKYENLSYVDYKKKSLRYLNIIAAPLYDAIGGVDGAISMAVDNTEATEHKEKIENLNQDLEKKVLERTIELDSANKKLNSALGLKLKFISDASHELRTPLTIIKGNFDLLLLGAKNESKDVLETYKEIEGEIHRMSSIISDLTMLTNADSKSEKIKLERIEINSLLESIVKSLTIIAKEKKIIINYKLSRKKIYIIGDEDKLDRVFINLIRNAIKYTNNNGLIEVFFEKKKNSLFIHIKDNGIGIPENDLPYIFERFYRVDRARSRMEGGTGLGLSISKWIVDSHNGEIKVKSREGVGSEFIVRLPTGKLS